MLFPRVAWRWRSLDAEMETDCKLDRGRHDSSTWPTITIIKLGINPFTPNIPLLLFSLAKSRVDLPRAEIPLRRDIWCSQQDSLQNERKNKLPSWEGCFSRLSLRLGKYCRNPL